MSAAAERLLCSQESHHGGDIVKLEGVRIPRNFRTQKYSLRNHGFTLVYIDIVSHLALQIRRYIHSPLVARREPQPSPRGRVSRCRITHGLATRYGMELLPTTGSVLRKDVQIIYG